MLRIRGLTKRYRTGEVALQGVSLEIPDSQVMALIGPSGAGKSTLIRCVNRLVEPTAGTITLNNTEITTLGRSGLRRARRRLGMIFQEFALVERLTVMENVLSGRLGYVGFWQSWFRRFPQVDIDEAFRLLARVGLDQMADKRADELSGGQRQRVGICRALIQTPELLLVDEPTKGVAPGIIDAIVDVAGVVVGRVGFRNRNISLLAARDNQYPASHGLLCRALKNSLLKLRGTRRVRRRLKAG